MPDIDSSPTTDSRVAARLAFARAALNDTEASLEAASADASARSYWRVRGKHGSAIVMDAPPGSGDLGA